MFGLTQIVPSLILLGGIAEDLRTRKVRNLVIVAMAVVALVAQYFFNGWLGVQTGALGFGMALLATLPLVLAGVLGAGDMKLLAAFGLATSWTVVLTVLFWSLIWGAALGVIQAIFSGQFSALMSSTVKIALRRDRGAAQIHKIPYTVALMFGWLSHLTISRLPGSWL